MLPGELISYMDRLVTLCVVPHLKAGRTPFDVNFVYLKTGKRFRVALNNRTGLYLISAARHLARLTTSAIRLSPSGSWL
jgi:hypothetical protein